MAPRNRDKKNTHLEGSNIKKIVRGGTTYYYWQCPEDAQLPDGTPIPKGKRLPLEHGNERVSLEAAHALNRKLLKSGTVVDKAMAKASRPVSRNPPLIEVLDQFEQAKLTGSNYSERSLKERLMKIRRYRREWPHTRVGQIDTHTIAMFLRQLSPESARQHRVLLDQIFTWAESEGFTTLRPMVVIERPRQQRRKRARHTWEGHKRIYDASPDWLKRAIKIALYSLQRRSDLCDITTNNIDMKEHTIEILQQKSRNYDKPVFIKIKMGDDFRQAVLDCIWSGIDCPYLLRHNPGRITKTMRESKPHPFYVKPDYLTRAYSDVRDELGIYDHLPKSQRPGIHSLRALGIWLYTKAGYSDEYIMALAGHASERMKTHYYDGHEKRTAKLVNADLSLDSVNLENIDWETDLSPKLKKLAEAGE
ncbi:tyrosine-type recombinase/integrase [Gilvimarinus chinensis]|uniref:tyrosine-type recombinase/integrase n=1 Tax=Gilvimarinus chinensis TaxID=396005 RepID=UPI0003742E7C|nr:tyrosine-type recombinase/integrase [Gilvimarinus chinensis]